VQVKVHLRLCSPGGEQYPRLQERSGECSEHFFLSGNSRFLMVFAILAALATSLVLYFVLGTKPTVAEDKEASAPSKKRAKLAPKTLTAQPFFV